MADLPDLPALPAEARRRVEVASEKARIRLRAEQQGCLRENSFRPYSGLLELDPERSAQASTEYSLAVFRAKVAEHRKIRAGHGTFQDWLTLLFKDVMAALQREWRGLSHEDRTTFEVVCLPEVIRALQGERDRWLLWSLDEEVPAGSNGGVSSEPPGRAEGGKGETPTAATWDAVEISFLSDERVQIRNGTDTETRNYGELGFADRRAKRGKPKPNQAWVVLRALAEQNGIIRDAAKTGGDWPKVEKRIQEIRRALRKHFGINADPVPFIDGAGYQARFKISCCPSFHT